MKTMIDRRFGVGVVVVGAFFWAVAAQAMINPRFTPVHLVRTAELVLWVDLKQGDTKDHYFANVREVLKGKTGDKSLRLNLSKARDEQSADALRELAAGGKPGLFFVARGPDDGGGAGETRGLLHMAGRWAVFDRAQNDVWVYDSIDRALQAVWAGGTDMLRRAVDYALQDEDAVVPVTDGVSWSEGPVKVAALEGAIGAVRPVDLAGNGKLVLFVACDKGDRLFACDGKDRKFTDVTSARGLQSKSQKFAWGDFAGRGRLDLISFDGKTISLHAQQADGKFQSSPLDLPKAMEDGRVALTALDCGVKGRSGLLVSGNSWPVVVALDVDGKTSSTALTAPNIDLTKLGKAGPSVVADFDGDGLADVLALREAGSVLFRGVSPGKFAPGVVCAVKLGKFPAHASLGDFDADGRLDVLAVNTEGTYLWQNEGEGKFTETLDVTGELAYGTERRGIDCMAGDVNNDGRQDVLIAYSAAAPRVFFNRGFRSFGFAQSLNLGWDRLLPAAKEGQQSACLGDLDGDGAQDLGMALRNGEIWVVFRRNEDREARMAVAALPIGGSYKGPVAVTGWIGKRCLGAWNVLPGVSPASFGRTDAGPVTLKWRLPSGKEHAKEVALEKKPLEIVWLDDRDGASERQEAPKTPPAQFQERVGGNPKALQPATKPAEAGTAAADETVVLDNTTLWRQFQVAGASHRRDATGKLVRCEVHRMDPASVAQGRSSEFSGFDSLLFSATSKDAFWSAPPPFDWAGVAFDDGAWPQAWLPQPAVYYRLDGGNAPDRWFERSNRPYDPVVVLARGKFEVKDPARVRACVLSLDYWGGVVVYVNGKEVARGHLSNNATNTDTVADDYPPEAFTTPDGKLLKLDDEKNADRLALRVRRLRDVMIPAAVLRKGVNVVAIEAHASPIHELLNSGDWGNKVLELGGWPPIGLLSARVTVSPAGAAVANVLRPRGVQVWNREVSDTVTPFDYGDPTESLRPITINAGRNTVFSGRLVVGSDQPIKGLKASVSDLASARGGAKIPAAAVRVRYAVTTSTPGKSWMNPYRFDGLLDAIPAEIPVIEAPVRREKTALHGELVATGWKFYSWPVDLTVFVPGAVAPLWFTVRVPRDAEPGVYEGKVNVEAEGLRPTTVPLRVNVSAWTARDPKHFRLQLFPYSLEESLAGHYNVPLWSDKHFELMGKSLALGTEINARQAFANLVVKADGRGSTNPESLVRWIKQPGGSFKHDFTIFDKYLDMVAKAIGKPHPLQLGWVGELSVENGDIFMPTVSVFDPKTGKVEEMKQPSYKDAEANVAFWRPVCDEVRKKLAARGWTDETLLACTYLTNGTPFPSTIDIANKLWPGAEWSSFAHGGPVTFPGTDKNVAMKVRLLGHVFNDKKPNSIRNTWEPSSRFISCKTYRNNASAGGLGHSSTADSLLLMEMRWRPEEMLRMGFDGWAPFGLDSFPLKSPSGGYYCALRSDGTRAFGRGVAILALLYPGPDGPVATERYEALREGMQLTEALLDIDQAIAENHARPLGGDLLQRAVRYRDERNKAFAYGWFGPRSVQTEDDRKRLDLAGEVAKYRPLPADNLRKD